MDRWKGVGASPGIAIGPAYPLDVSIVVAERHVASEEVEPELARFDAAISATDQQLALLQQQLTERDGGDAFEVIEADRTILRSSKLAGAVRHLIRDKRFGADWAVRLTVERMRAAFSRLDDRYLRERGSDFEGLGERLLRALLGMPELQPGHDAPAGSIAVGTEIGPLHPFQLKRAGLVGVATRAGGRTSQTAILARALDLPYVVGVDLSARVRPGDTLILDGGRGEVVHRPDQETLDRFELLAEAEQTRAARLSSMSALPAVTLDGVPIHLAANLQQLSEVTTAVEAGVESVGLFRTELLYLERPDLPTEEEQYQDAVAVLKALGGRPVTFRTFDLGGDKLPSGVRRPKVANPALGLRSIRLALQRRDLFRTQLRALYRASAVGPIRILLPLISGVTELAEAQDLCDDVCAELAREGQAFNRGTPVGIMIETPSAALTVDHLADGCDFFSIGTNDLIQYAFAADRENEDVGYLYQPLHPAVLRMLKQIVDAARIAKRPVAISGDMAQDPAFTWILLGLGLRELSMAPRHIPVVKSVIRSSYLAEAEHLVARALALRSELEVERLVLGVMGQRFGPELEGAPHATVESDLSF